MHPDASVVLLDAGSFDDGGQYLRLQDVDFDAFKDFVELRAVTETWEAAPRQIPVTRWRWRRVVAAPTGTLRIQQPTVEGRFAPRRIAIGTQDTTTTGRIIQLDEEGLPTGAHAGWSAAVTTLLPEVDAVVGLDIDGGFISFDSPGVQSRVFERLHAPAIAAATVDYDLLVLTANGRVTSYEPWFVRDYGQCAFDGGLPKRLIAGYGMAYVISEAGEVCLTSHLGPPTRNLPIRVRPMSVAGPPDGVWMTTTSGSLFRAFPGEVDAGPRNADFMVVLNRYFDPGLFAATPGSIQFWPNPWPDFAAPPISTPLSAPLATSPVFRLSGSRRWLLTLDTAGALRSFNAANLKEQWAWRPDGGLNLQAPLGFAPSESRLGTLLMVVDGAVLAVVADGAAHDMWYLQDSWTMESGWNSNCHQGCINELAIP